MDGGEVIMANILFKNGLIFANATLTHGTINVLLINALIDTGSSSTVISSEIAHKLGLKPEANDLINSVQSVGGLESVYEKKIDSIKLDVSEASSFHIQV
jgi:predicted aspartyl protease